MSVLAYIIFVIAAVLAFAVGAVGGYFYLKARTLESADDLEALRQDLLEREEELHRLQDEITRKHTGNDRKAQEGVDAEIKQLREDLEKKKNDYDILKQDFDVELGVLKQEVDQFKARNSDVDQSRRQFDRKDDELAKREESLRSREKELAEREALISTREKEIEKEVAIQRREVEQALVDRERTIHLRLESLQQAQEALARSRKELSDRESRLDEEFMALPEDKFTSRREAVVIKQLRQQNQMQRKELEQLQRLHDRARLQSESDRHAQHRAAATGDVDAREHGPHHAPDHLRKQPFDQERDTSSEDPLPSSTLENDYRIGAMGTAARSASTSANGPIEETEVQRDAVNGRQKFDDLTGLLGIDRNVQQELNKLGITSFDQIARWSSADIRRISERLDVDPKTIQDHWIINAQSHVFAVSIGSRDHME